MQKEKTLEQHSGKTSALGEATPDVTSSTLIQPLSSHPTVSGLYLWRQSVILSSPIPQSSDPLPELPVGMGSEASAPSSSEELRLDVDGRYPQMVASGVIHGGIFSRIHWIANVAPSGPNTWTGVVFYKDGNAASFPYTSVKIQVIPNVYPSQRKARVTLSGGGSTQRVRTFRFASPSFRAVNFEFDYVENEPALLKINTGDHPNRPSTLDPEEMAVQSIFERAGFNVTTSPGDKVPLKGAGANARWSYQEMHDAMQTYWSHFASKAQWAMWIFFAGLNEEDGKSLGGIMFDDIGAQHRQGTAIFNRSFIADPPPQDQNPEAWVRRMNFWTTCHEMGHCFNLAHSWDKAEPKSWIPLVADPEARSFMNYPYEVSGGQSAFFASFEFRFSDGELLFMRHAPERFVQMGNAEWFDNHGFREANVSPEPKFKLVLRVNREKPIFEFMEPVVLELKLTNISDEPQMVKEKLLSTLERITLVVKKNGKPARHYAPHAQYCWQPKNKVLMPNESVRDSLFVSAGRNGWEISEPGYYTIQAALDLGNEDLVSNPLTLRVAPPRGYNEEYLAQDFFSDDVGRILNFDGSRYLTNGNDTLREVTAQLPNSKAAIHARLPLAKAMASSYKYLELGKTVQEAKQAGRAGEIKIAKPDMNEASEQFDAALNNNPNEAAETLGHVDYKNYVNLFRQWLLEQGEKKKAAQAQEKCHDTLKARGVPQHVLDEIKGQSEADVKDNQSAPRKSRARVAGR